VSSATSAIPSFAATWVHEHPYRYEDRGGTRVSARELGVDEHVVVKTLVMQDDEGEPLIVLMHGDGSVHETTGAADWRRSVEPCAPAVVERHTGYVIGGCRRSARAKLRVFIERTILEIDRCKSMAADAWIPGSLAPSEIVRVLARRR
jgi:prolyl-tRNA editing enzyme YbaK/EbsC (Cys-tRNA(Pro) deacylase)